MSNLIVGIILSIIGAVIAVIGFLTARTLRGVDENQQALSRNIKDLWTHHDSLKGTVDKLVGQHEVNHKFKFTVEKS